MLEGKGHYFFVVYQSLSNMSSSWAPIWEVNLGYFWSDTYVELVTIDDIRIDTDVDY